MRRIVGFSGFRGFYFVSVFFLGDWEVLSISLANNYSDDR